MVDVVDVVLLLLFFVFVSFVVLGWVVPPKVVCEISIPDAVITARQVTCDTP